MDLKTIHAYADGELSGAEAQMVREWIANDERARAEYDAILNLKAFVRTHAATYTSEETWRLCMGRLAEIDRSKRAENFVNRYAWALCAFVFGCILVAGAIQRNPSNRPVDTAQMAQMFASVNASDAQQRNVAALDAWIDRRFAEANESSRPDRLEMTQPMEAEFDGKPVLMTTLRDGKGFANLMVCQGVESISGLTPIDSEGHYQGGYLGSNGLVAWRVNGACLILTGDRSPSELVDLAKRLEKR